MLILSLDSTSQTASVALSDNDKFLAGTLLNIGNKHSTTLLPAVSFVLEQAGRSISDVGLIAVIAGPGSFTGVRIGAAAAKGLALGRDIPCVGVSSLEAMAEGFSFADGIVCPMINARRDRYFTAYFFAEKGCITRLCEDDTVPGDEIEKYLAEQNRTVYLTGDGTDVFLGLHGGVTPTAVPEMLKYPFAYYGGVLARRIYEESDEAARAGFTAEALRPVYLRQPQAERELQDRIKNHQ